MFKVGNSVRYKDTTLKWMREKPRGAIGKARGKVISLQSPHGDKWIEVKWDSDKLTHRYDNIHQLVKVK